MSGLNFLIANTSPSFAGRSPGRIHSSGFANLSEGECAGIESALSVEGGNVEVDEGSRMALYTLPYVPRGQLLTPLLGD